jgi:hypothetical protein
MSHDKGRRGTKTSKTTVYMTEEEERTLAARAAENNQTLQRFLVECGLREAMRQPQALRGEEVAQRIDALETWARANGFDPDGGGLAERLAS